MEAKALEALDKFISDNKSKRKFTQSVELAVNFKGIDFSNQQNRLNLDVLLPKGKGKSTNIIVFADKRDVSEKARSLGAKQVISSAEVPQISSDKVKRNELLEYDLLAEPSLMPIIAKNLGQFLGPRNKMPKPIIGDMEKLFQNLSGSITLKSKGKYLPTIHCVVGNEAMAVQDIAENIDSVVNALVKKIGKPSIKSVYTKLTMSSAIKLM
ncbi:MAG: 50S ribosomal protein L1 [Candidatus Marsarchaeota archaeon]|nr:50S ribosomal protein L1 [Candidatus Marsarchaeota archaeon]MCL5106441.1 50S ribosomal protein L1 [Candidatus Marsarchaeota archaeon]